MKPAVDRHPEFTTKVMWVLVALETLAAAFVLARPHPDGYVINLLGAAVFIALAIGLIRRVEWARLMNSVFLFLSILIAIFGALNPFTASDSMANGEEINPTKIITYVFLWVLVSLFFLHFLGLFKSQCRSKFL